MTDRNVSVNIRANVADFMQGMRSAGAATDKLARDVGGMEKVSTTSLGRMRQSMETNRAAWDSIGGVALKIGAVLTGGIAAATKAAISWESAWTGVTKTVEGTDAQLSALEGELRGLAKTLPSTHAEIAGVAEAAGQLGIQTGNVASFTKTMIDLGEATNLSANEAATALARFANIMGTNQDKFSNLGSAIVALGNNFATTEREIVDMAQRIAGAGRQAGLTEADVLGLATALSSVGIEAEAGGTAISRVLIEMRKAVDSGGPKLEAFARTAGMTGEEFQRAFKQNAGGAVTGFIEGLGRMDKAGKSVQPTLEQLGMTDVRVGNALRSAASASGMFAGAMQTSNKAFADNVALGAEAEKRYATAESRIKIAWNNIKDAAINVGGAIAPMVSMLADMAAGFASAIGALPGPIQGVIGVMTLLGGTVTLAAGAFARIAPGVLQTVAHLRDLGAVTPGVAGKIGKIGLAFGGIAAAIPLVVSLIGAYAAANQNAQKRVKDLANTLDSATGKFTESSAELLRASMAAKNSFQEASGRVGWVSLEEFTKKVGISFSEIAAAVSGSNEQFDAMAARFRALKGDYNDEQISALTRALRGMRSEYEEAVKVAEDDAVAKSVLKKNSEEAVGSEKKLSGAIKETAKAYDAQADAIKNALSQSREMYGIAKDRISAENDYRAAIENASKALKENGATLDQSTAKGRANWDVLLKTAGAAHDQAKAMEAAKESQEAVQAKIQEGRNDFIRQAEAFGMNSEKAREYADKLGLIPENVATQVDANVSSATAKLQEFIAKIDAGKGVVGIDGNAYSGESSLDGFLKMIGLSREQVGIGADESSGIKTVNDFIGWTKAQSAKATIDANPEAARSVVDKLFQFVRGGATMPISANTSSARSAINDLKGIFNRGWSIPMTLDRATGGPVYGLASGGAVRGPGTGTSDSIVALGPRGVPNYRLSNGEHIWTARETLAVGGHLAMLRLRKLALDGGLAGVTGRAAGGSVTHSTAVQPRWESPRQVVAVAQISSADIDRLADRVGERVYAGSRDGYEGRTRREMREARMGGSF